MSHTDKTPVPNQSDSPQYLKGFGEPMPFCSHSEYVAAKKLYSSMTYYHRVDVISNSDEAERLHLEKRINNHEKQSR